MSAGPYLRLRNQLSSAVQVCKRKQFDRISMHGVVTRWSPGGLPRLEFKGMNGAGDHELCYLKSCH